MWQVDHLGVARDQYVEDKRVLPPHLQESLSQEEYEQQSNALWEIHEQNILVDSQKTPGNIMVKQAHTGNTLKLGVEYNDWKWDTGIEVTPEQSAFLSGLEDQVGDPWRGGAQWLKEQGYADLIDIEVQDKQEDIMRKLYGDEALGTSAKIGGGVGVIGEPLAWVLPFSKAMKAKSLFNVFVGSAALGGLYGGSMYVDKDESRTTNAIITAALMGPLSVGMAKYFRHAVGDDVADAIETAAAKEAEAGKTIVPGTEHRPFSYKEFSDSLKTGRRKSRKGEKQNRPRGKVDREGKPVKGKAPPVKPKRRKRKDEKTKEERQETTLDGLAVKSNMEGRKQGILMKLWTNVTGGGDEAGGIFNRAMEPIYDTLRKLTPKVAAQLRVADGTQHLLSRKWTDRTIEWTRWYEKTITKAQRAQLKLLINNGGMSKAVLQVIREMGGEAAVKEAMAVKAVLKEIHGELRRVGYKIGHIDSYHPNAVSDMEQLVARRQSQIDKAYAKAKAAKGGKNLTQNEKAHIAQHMFEFDVRYSTTSGSLKNRKKYQISEEEIGFYHDPTVTLHNYIHSMSEDIAKRRFFKGFGHKAHKTKGLNPTGVDIDDSIDSLIDQIRFDVPGHKEQNQIVSLLRARFGPDVMKTHRFVQAAKNLSFAGTLGNWWSAMTQIGDIVFVGHKYGVMNAAAAILGPRITHKEMLGLQKAMQELVSSGGVTNKIADWAFKWSGFSKIDSFGKTAHMNASLRLNKKLAKNNPEKFNKAWGNYFGAETEALRVELLNLELKKGAKLSDNAYLMLWNDLAETQPIGLSEMPLWYLQNPNGRVGYAYKTFAMKQFNYMRKIITDKNRNIATRTADLVYFSSMFVMANTGIDVFKDYMAGGDLDIEDIALDNLFTLALTSKYAIDKSNGLGSAIQESLLPVPYTQAADAMDNISTGSTTASQVIGQLPIVGALERKRETFTDLFDL